jgi:hypothetical protein
MPEHAVDDERGEFGCVNGVVVSAATAATNANPRERGDLRPSRR